MNEDRSNVIWVCHALTANSDVADWWEHTVEEFKNIEATASDRPELHVDYVENFTLKNVKVNGQKVN